MIEPLRDFVSKKQRFVAAHRGSSGTAPENTIAAFREAIDVGVMMIETDIQFTADDRVVIFHDGKLERTTNGNGTVGEKSYDEIRLLDNGAWYSENFRGEKIPLLEEMIDFIDGRVYLNIEIKSRNSSPIAPRLEKILDIIYKKGYDQATLFSSFDHKLIEMIKKSDSNLHTAAIMIPGSTVLPSEISKQTGCEAFVCSIEELTRDISDDAHSNGIYIGVYSIDTPEEYEKAFALGVNAIVTNYPARIMEIFNADSRKG